MKILSSVKYEGITALNSYENGFLFTENIASRSSIYKKEINILSSLEIVHIEVNWLKRILLIGLSEI